MVKRTFTDCRTEVFKFDEKDVIQTSTFEGEIDEFESNPSNGQTVGSDDIYSGKLS